MLQLSILLLLPILWKVCHNKAPKLVKTFLFFISYYIISLIPCESSTMGMYFVWAGLITLFVETPSHTDKSKQVGLLSTGLLLTLYITSVVPSATMLIHLFICVETLLVVAVYFLAFEQNLNQHGLLYIIPNIILGVVFLIGVACLCTETALGVSLDFLIVLKGLHLSTVMFDIGCTLIALVLLGKLGSFPIMLVLPQVYSNLPIYSVAFLSIGVLPPFVSTFLVCTTFIPSYILIYVLFIACLSVVIGSFSIFYTKTVAQLLAGFSILNNNMIIILALGLPAFLKTECQDFLLSYILSIIPFYFLLVPYNGNMSLESFIDLHICHNQAKFFYFVVVCFTLAVYLGVFCSF